MNGQPIFTAQVPIYNKDDLDAFQAFLNSLEARHQKNSGSEGGAVSPFTNPANPKPDDREGNSGATISSAPEKPATKRKTKKADKSETIDISAVREKIHEILQRGPQAKPFVLETLKKFAPETGRLSDVTDLAGLSQALGE